MKFIPPYPIPHKTKSSFLLRFLRGWRSWLDVLFEKSYSMKMGQFSQPGMTAYMVNDPDWVKQILVKNPKAYPKHQMMHRMLEPLLGSSIFTTNGEVWERQRALVDQAFAQARLKLVFPLMVESVQDMLHRLDKVADGQSYEVDSEMTYIAADIIFKTILSKSLDAESAKTIYEAFITFQHHAQKAMMLMVYRLPPYFSTRASRKPAQKIRAILAAIIAKRYEERAQGVDGHYKDILSGLMNAKDPITGSQFSYEEMVDQICMLFLAGHETSASALAWSLYLLSNCSDLQAKILAEIDEKVLGKDIGYSEIKQLQWVNDTFREAMRLYPPVGFFVREAIEDHCMRDKEVKAGSPILVSPWLIHRHREMWDDPDTFAPERFQTESGRASIKCAYIPFSKGPRVCIGAAFATQEAILTLASIVRRYEILPVETHTPRVVGRVTIRSDNGIRIRLKLR
ncbi:MAG TPA: cytochrome P450 [Methylotenera sp.]|nr:cytochrome P450 [Methylotenera sp.]